MRPHQEEDGDKRKKEFLFIVHPVQDRLIVVEEEGVVVVEEVDEEAAYGF